MGLFSRLKNAMSKTSGDDPREDGLETVRNEMRMHTRYSVSFHKNAHFKIGNDWIGRVMDISYGGLAVKFEQTGASGSLPLEGSADVNILGISQRFDVKTVRTVPQQNGTVYSGMCISHSSPETLIYLREIIEPMRQGLTIDMISDEVRAEKYRGEGWHCFRGEGPVDLVFLLTKENEVAEGLATFKVADFYYEVAIQNGTVRTAKSAEKSGQALAVGAKMVPTARPDPAILRRAFLILASAPAPVAEKSAAFLAAVEKSMVQSSTNAA